MYSSIVSNCLVMTVLHSLEITPARSYRKDLFLVVAYSFWILNLISKGFLQITVLTELSCPTVKVSMYTSTGTWSR